MGQVAAAFHQLQPISQQGLSGALLRCSQDAVLRAPQHLNRRCWQWRTNPGKAAAAGKTGKSSCPAWGAQMQAGDFFFRWPH